LAALTACASGAKARKAQRPQARAAPATLTDRHVGTFHTVRQGENLFRIAQGFGVPTAVIARENGITDPAKIEVGQRLFIPGVEGPQASGLGPQAVAQPVPPPAKPPRPRPAARKPQVASRKPLVEAPPPTAGALQWPVHGVLFSPFGARPRDQHDGIDLAAPEGTPVVAAEAGTVLFAGKQRGYGNLILVGHDGDVVTVYAHNQENLVERGQRIRRGALIARVGKSGNATGPHLHFEVRVAARPKDPLTFLR
jgi:murein DD-endopeptidase MepM/ murein hydrolase activator NlpD